MHPIFHTVDVQGVDDDQYFSVFQGDNTSNAGNFPTVLAPQIISSMLKRVDNAVTKIVEDDLATTDGFNYGKCVVRILFQDSFQQCRDETVVNHAQHLTHLLPGNIFSGIGNGLVKQAQCITHTAIDVNISLPSDFSAYPVPSPVPISGVATRR